MANIIGNGYDGKRPLTFKKHKEYDKEVKIDKDKSFTEAIQQLRKSNRCLWDLEDTRRNLLTSDESRLEAADSVSVHNKVRNDTVDLIDDIVVECIDMIRNIK
jgi:hypothetical protein